MPPKRKINFPRRHSWNQGNGRPYRKRRVIKAQEIAKEVDLILFLFPQDGNKKEYEIFKESTKELRKLSHLTLFTKSDLGQFDSNFIENDSIEISCKTRKISMFSLIKLLKKLTITRMLLKTVFLSPQHRHLTLLEEAEKKA